MSNTTYTYPDPRGARDSERHGHTPPASNEEFREEARRCVPDTWRVDDLAQVMRSAEGGGAWVSVWMWMWEESANDDVHNLPFTAQERERMKRFGDTDRSEVE